MNVQMHFILQRLYNHRGKSLNIGVLTKVCRLNLPATIHPESSNGTMDQINTSCVELKTSNSMPKFWTIAETELVTPCAQGRLWIRPAKWLSLSDSQSCWWNSKLFDFFEAKATPRKELPPQVQREHFNGHVDTVNQSNWKSVNFDKWNEPCVNQSQTATSRWENEKSGKWSQCLRFKVKLSSLCKR